MDELDFELSICDGKYTYLRYKNGRQGALRYGEYWRDLVGDNFVGALASDLNEAKTKFIQAQQRIAGLEAARVAYASEFPADEYGEPDVGSIHQNIRDIKKKFAQVREEAIELHANKARLEAIAQSYEVLKSEHIAKCEETRQQRKRADDNERVARNYSQLWADEAEKTDALRAQVEAQAEVIRWERHCKANKFQTCPERDEAIERLKALTAAAENKEGGDHG